MSEIIYAAAATITATLVQNKGIKTVREAADLNSECAETFAQGNRREPDTRGRP